MPSWSPMACFVPVRRLGSQALRVVWGGMGWYGWYGVVWGGMGWYTTSAAATRAQRASCMRTRTECALPPLERHRGAMRVPPPNAQVSERAKACRARRTR